MSEVVLLKDLHWQFDDDRACQVYNHNRIYVDPCPAYNHDVNLVKEEFDRVFKNAPLINIPKVLVLSYEVTSRTNGYADSYFNSIVLSAKRTPIHPDMTKYLVSHEYGHHVQYNIDFLRGDENVLYNEDSNVLVEYQKLRGGSFEYGPAKWHLNVGELFANDFRILVACSEVEFWPHPDFVHPLDSNSGVRDFWADITEELQISAVV